MLYNWLQHIEFKYTWVLPLLLMIPVLIWLYYRTPRWRKAALTVTTTRVYTVRTFRNHMVHLPFWLRVLALACVLLALARPQVRDVQNKNRGQGIDIVLCMDVSGSMLSADFIPNRLEVAKQMAMDFVRHRPIDEIGLVIFSGESFTQFPVSTDYNGLLDQIAGLRSGMLTDGTVIGEGLATSVERLRTTKGKSKVIILLTDGNEQPPETRLIDPYTALEIAKAKGVKVYTIGMGGSGVRTVDEKGVAKSQGSAFLDESLLRRIASQTGGSYFRATDKQNLGFIYKEIDRLEKSNIEVVSRTRFEEQYFYFLMAALFSILLDIILRYTYLRSFP